MAFPLNPIDGQPHIQAGALYIYSAQKSDWILFAGNIPGADAVNWRDDYNPTVSYSIRDGVLDGGRSFRALQDNNKGNPPPSSGTFNAHWHLVADRGDIGLQGQSIDHISRTAGTGAAGTVDTYTVWGDALETITLGTFVVQNGANGAGDMAAANNLSDLISAVTARTNLGLSNVQNIKHNFTATVAPGATDDVSAGYSAGSRWLDTAAGKAYECLDATATAAVWKETTNPASAGGAAPTMQIFTTSGTYTKPAGLTAVRVRVVGGGGGGARGITGYTGSGGGGGGYAEKLIDAAVIGATEIVTIGAGGAGGAAIQAPGIIGGVSSFGVHCSGSGGTAGTTSSWVIRGGVGTGGDVNVRGGAGHPAIYTEANSANQPAGGNTPLGMGSLYIANASITYGYQGSGYGSGGAGVRAGGGSAGVGAAGVVIVEEIF